MSNPKTKEIREAIRRYNEDVSLPDVDAQLYFDLYGSHESLCVRAERATHDLIKPQLSGYCETTINACEEES